MSLILDKRCEMCGGTLEIDDDGKKGKCEYCGNTYTYVKPLTPDSVTNINRADNYRLKNMFDSAIVEYKTLLQNEEYADNAEVWWGLLLAEFGIEYVRDTREDVYVPTCHRTAEGSVFENECYKNAIKFATEEMKEVYARMAREIDELQSAIKAQSGSMDNYEVFICFKATDNRVATEDRYIARKIFDELTKRGFKTFFSEVSLKGRLGREYEPVIYKALTTSRIMLLVCTDEKYLNAPFVRNEWSRFKDRKKDDPSLSIIPVFRNIDPAMFPSKEQGINLDKYPAGGYEVDIADNLESMLGKHAVPKVDKEILEEYSRYNEINKIKFEKEYETALREVDLSPARKKNAGLEFAAKAKEMEALGNYKNAIVLSKEYRMKAAVYEEFEKKQNKLNKIFASVSLLIAVGLAVYAVLLMIWNSGINFFDRSLMRPDSDIFALDCVLTGLSVFLCLFIAVSGTIFADYKYKFNIFVRIELYVYAASFLCMIIPLSMILAYEGSGGGNVSSFMYYFILVSGIAFLFVLNLFKSFFNRGLRKVRSN